MCHGDVRDIWFCGIISAPVRFALSKAIYQRFRNGQHRSVSRHGVSFLKCKFHLVALWSMQRYQHQSQTWWQKQRVPGCVILSDRNWLGMLNLLFGSGIVSSLIHSCSSICTCKARYFEEWYMQLCNRQHCQHVNLTMVLQLSNLQQS